jgi:anti-sigma factor RsiW
MNEATSRRHLSAEALQALLEGQLPAGERLAMEEHLAACVSCAGDLAAWTSLFEDLDALTRLTPSEGFAQRVMAGTTVPRPGLSLGRVFGWLDGRHAHEHPDGDRLQDFAEGRLPSRAAARIRTHLDGCPACAASAAGWRETFRQLGSLERLAPSPDFGARVMARVHVPAPAPAPVSEGRRALAWLRGLLPHTREAWAAVSGVAVAPAATLGLVLWTLFSHPTLTPGALLSFTGWKITEFAGLLWQGAASAAMGSAGVFDLVSLLSSAMASPATLAGAVLAFCVGTVVASWVLYRNLFASHPADGRIAHAQFS